MSASAAPPLPTAGEDLYATKAPQTLAIIIIFPILATVTVLLRLYTRFRIVDRPAYDDFAMLIALIFTIATTICQGFQVYNGMGRHVQTLTIEQGIGSLKALFASIVMYNFALTFIKTSILLQYLRISIDKRVRKGCFFVLALVVANCIQTLFSGIFTCTPPPKFWDDRIPGTCVNKPALWFANAGINIFTDFCLVILPIFILKKLVLPRREKISLVLILGLGGFASLASVLRLHAMYIVSISKDITWDNPGTATWSAMELSIGIICASLPTLRAFMAKHVPQVFHSQITNPREKYSHGTPTSIARRATPVPDPEMCQSGGDIVVGANIEIQREEGSTSPQLEETVTPPPREEAASPPTSLSSGSMLEPMAIRAW